MKMLVAETLPSQTFLIPHKMQFYTFVKCHGKSVGTTWSVVLMSLICGSILLWVVFIDKATICWCWVDEAFRSFGAFSFFLQVEKKRCKASAWTVTSGDLQKSQQEWRWSLASLSNYVQWKSKKSTWYLFTCITLSYSSGVINAEITCNIYKPQYFCWHNILVKCKTSVYGGFIFIVDLYVMSQHIMWCKFRMIFKKKYNFYNFITWSQAELFRTPIKTWLKIWVVSPDLKRGMIEHCGLRAQEHRTQPGASCVRESVFWGLQRVEEV